MANTKNKEKEAGVNYRPSVAFLKEDCYPYRYYPASDKPTEPGKYVFKGKVGELQGKVRRL